jgi:hypothetical protein
MTFDEKYGSATPSALFAVNPMAIDDPEEIVWLCYKLDEIAGDAEAEMMIMGQPEELAYENRRAYVDQMTIYRRARALKVALQQRRANMKAAARNASDLRRANAFIDCARLFLAEDDSDDFNAIWDLVYEKHPDLRPST